MTPGLLRLFLGAAALAIAAPALAQSAPPDIRQVDMVDGRTIFGGVVTTEPGGIRLSVPQGETVIGFHQLKNIQPGTAAEWANQRVWEVVVVGPDEERRMVEQAVRTYSSIKAAGDEGIPRALTAGQLNNARACAPADLPCTVSATARPDAWSWVVTVEPTASGGATLRSITSKDSAADRVALDNLRDADALLTALDQLLDLSAVPGRAEAAGRLQAVLGDKRAPKEKVAKAPKAPKEPKVARAPKEPKVAKAPREPRQPREPVASIGLEALVPIPGYPALKRGDMTSFGVALGVALPATAAWVGATGSQAQSLPEHAALSLGGYYLSTVVINHVVGARMKRTGVAVGPTERGRGASLQVRVALD